jgi:hypothetical protein
MASIIDLDTRRRRAVPPGRPARRGVSAAVTCDRCGESHPIVRLPNGERRCLTAFFDGSNWFCRNRGCRRAWLDGDGQDG